MGCCHFLAAKLLSCSWSSPRSGGAANNGPITLKRKRAHRSWERATPKRLDIAPFIFFRRCGRCRSFYHRCRSGGDRPQELQHSQQTLALLELKAQPQRQRQRPFAQRRHKPGPNGFPEGAADKTIQPPLAPTLQRARVDLQCFPDPTDPSWLQPMNHHRDQHDHQARIDPAPQETHRLRGSPPPAIFFGAAKAIASVPLRTTTRLPIKIGTMQLPMAKKTALLTSLLGQIRIDFLQQLV